MNDFRDTVWELLEFAGGIAALLLPVALFAPVALVLVAIVAAPVAALVLVAAILGGAVALVGWAARSLWGALTARRAGRRGALQPA